MPAARIRNVFDISNYDVHVGITLHLRGVTIIQIRLLSETCNLSVIKLKYISLAYSSQESHISQLDPCN
jgi:hypothetical protein